MGAYLSNAQVESVDSSIVTSVPDYSLLANENKYYLELVVRIRRFKSQAIVHQKKILSGPPEHMRKIYDDLNTKSSPLLSDITYYDNSDSRDQILGLLTLRLYTDYGIKEPRD